MIDPVILVHGGAGDIPEWRVPLKLNGVRKAARAGYISLSKDECSALDAVEAAVKVMEDDEAFNAGTDTAMAGRGIITVCCSYTNIYVGIFILFTKGKGSVLTIKSTVEMDAIIMEGKNLKTGTSLFTVKSS